MYYLTKNNKIYTQEEVDIINKKMMYAMMDQEDMDRFIEVVDKNEDLTSFLKKGDMFETTGVEANKLYVVLNRSEQLLVTQELLTFNTTDVVAIWKRQGSKFKRYAV